MGESKYFKAMRDVRIASGFCSQMPKDIHFGLDSKQKYDLLIVFPSGIKMERRNVSTGQTLTIEEMVVSDRK